MSDIQKESLSTGQASTNFAALPKDVVLGDSWDTRALRQVIDERCADGRKPTHLFLGMREAQLLRQHLGSAFGEENASSLEHIWYMGLRVVELQSDSVFRVAGNRFVNALGSAPESLSRLSKDEILAAWRFDLDSR